MLKFKKLLIKITLQGMIFTWKRATSWHLLFLNGISYYYSYDCTCFTEFQASCRELERGSYLQPFCGNADGFVASSSHFFFLLFIFVLTVFVLAFARCAFEDVCFCVLRHVFNSPVKPSFHMWCRFGKCFLTACQYDWCWLDLVVMYVYLTQQMRSSFVRSGQSFKWGTSTPGCFECSQVYSCCIISAGICETSAKISLWSFNQTCVYCACLRVLTNSPTSIKLLVRERFCVCSKVDVTIFVGIFSYCICF